MYCSSVNILPWHQARSNAIIMKITLVGVVVVLQAGENKLCTGPELHAHNTTDLCYLQILDDVKSLLMQQL